MLKEIKLRQAVDLMEEGNPVYAVNLETEERQLVDLTSLFAGIRLLADLPEDTPSEIKVRRGRRTKELSDQAIKDFAAGIDQGKVKALQEGKWTTAQIADEFGFTVPEMERIIAVLEQQ